MNINTTTTVNASSMMTESSYLTDEEESPFPQKKNYSTMDLVIENMADNMTTMNNNNSDLSHYDYFPFDNNLTKTENEFLLRANMLDDGEQDASNVPLNCFLLFILVAICYSMKPNVPDASHHHGLIFRERARRREENKKDPERRKRFIQASLITKRVIACESENKALRLGDLTRAASMGSFSINSLEDENVSSCAICLDAFHKGDIVTWAKNSEDCRHVFHQECLEQWLINPKHNDCPYCRCQIMHDIGDETEPDDEDEPMSSSQFVFVIMNGLISPLRRASVSLIGSSVNFSDTEDDDASTNSPLTLKRVLSFGSLSGAIGKRELQAVFRRVSSGLSSHRDNDDGDSFHDDDDGLEDDCNSKKGRRKKLKEPHSFRRVASEGLHTSPRLRRKKSSSSSSRIIQRSNLSYESIGSESQQSSIGDDDTSYNNNGELSPIESAQLIFPQNLAAVEGGVSTTPRTNNYQRLEFTDSGGDDNTKLPLELELEFGDNDFQDNHRYAPKSLPKPRMSFAFNLSSGGVYSKICSNPVANNNNCSDEEESLVSFSVGQEEDGDSIESMV